MSFVPPLESTSARAAAAALFVAVVMSVSAVARANSDSVGESNRGPEDRDWRDISTLKTDRELRSADLNVEPAYGEDRRSITKSLCLGGG